MANNNNLNNNLLYIYNVGLKNIILEHKVEDRIGLEIYRKIEHYLRSSNENPIPEDNYKILEKIQEWMMGKSILKSELRKFFDSIIGSFRTKSSEVSRNIVIYLSKESEMFLIHTREDISVINYQFDNLIKVGLSKGNILRAFKFYISEGLNEIVFRHRESNKSKILMRLFGLESFHFDYTSVIRISCTNSARNLSYHVSLSPIKFFQLYDERTLRFDIENQRIIFPPDYLEIVSLKVKNNTFPPTKIRKFLDAAKKELENPIIKPRDKYLKHYKAKRLELKIDVEPWTIEKFTIKKEQNYKIVEYSNKIDFILENERNDVWHKPTIEWGTLILLDEDIEFSTEFLKVLNFEILKGSSTGRKCFIQLEYTAIPFEIGLFKIHNSPELGYIDVLLDTLQSEFKNTYDLNYKKILLITMLTLLKSSGFYQFKYFAENMVQEILKKEKIDISREVEENYILEFKGNSFFEVNARQNDIAQYIVDSLIPNLSNSNIVSLLLGYDETSDQIQPINYNNFKIEEKQELQSKIIEILKSDYNFEDDNLIIDIHLLNQKKDKGLILIVAGYSVSDDDNEMMKSLFAD
ncbi:hypothetical protein LCGC14_0908650 [marine sediment metagenome]|uniref:Uncharacterized protein n=1 Tax=marine sediment metagenome TaxID=412755 RepID=A0A0F9S136_9ZZZZ